MPTAEPVVVIVLFVTEESALAKNKTIAPIGCTVNHFVRDFDLPDSV